MRVYHDWEFIDDGRTIEPISVGMAAEDSRTYYAVFKSTPIDRVMQRVWLRDNVLPHLPLLHFPGRGTPELNYLSPLVKNPVTIRNEVSRFLLDTPRLELWGWYSGYDHVAFAQMWGPMVYLPEGIPMWTNDLRQEALRLGLDECDIPPPDPQMAHNALEDAKHMLKIAAYLKEVERAARAGNPEV